MVLTYNLRHRVCYFKICSRLKNCRFLTCRLFFVKLLMLNVNVN
jgi:hypothetical protein